VQLKNLANDVLSAYKKLPKSVVLPQRIIHGDLKIANILFNDQEDVIALIDLDTFMNSTIATELGDALRSWCMSGGEDADVVIFDREVYRKALHGYFSTAIFLSEIEKKSISHGVKLITLELTARFIIDAFDENYFRLDLSKYKTLFEQNKKRAENQFSFFKEFSFFDQA
jgi:Ser/Thr protein kinase RdoA (MazF antagonist)